MNNSLLKSKEEQLAAVENARSFMSHPFWGTFKAIVDANIALVRNRLATETFEDVADVKRLQDKIRAYEEVVGTPEIIIEAYDPNVEKMEEVKTDPFQSIEEFRVELRKARNNA
jgi:hypothetical protein